MNHFLLIILLSALSQTSATSAVLTMCPFVGGSAVYKARTLYALLNPMAQYNDRLMCMQGQNKNGNSGYVNLDSLYEAETNVEANKLSQLQSVNANNPTIQYQKIPTDKFEDILIYPNPAKSHIFIEGFRDNATFELYDMYGKIILTKNLYAEVEKHKIEIPNISNGIYNFKIKLDKEFYCGKLNVIQNEK